MSTGIVASPARSSVSTGSSRAARSVLRTRARGCSPASTAHLTTWRPTPPVAPITSIVPLVIAPFPRRIRAAQPPRAEIRRYPARCGGGRNRQCLDAPHPRPDGAGAGVRRGRAQRLSGDRTSAAVDVSGSSRTGGRPRGPCPSAARSRTAGRRGSWRRRAARRPRSVP